jgi:hypothetical protein
VLPQEFVDRFPTFFGIHPEYRQTPGLVLLKEFFQRRSLLQTVWSPGGPEVKKNDLPLEIFDVREFPLEVVQGKVREGQRLCIGLKNTCGPTPLRPSQIRPLESQKKKAS